MPKTIGKTYYQAVDALNPKQREAFDAQGNTVLLAGPGSGKTATLVLKVARLLDEIPAPRGLACLTYGNEAAREFEQRLRGYGIRSGGRLFTGTVHSFCLAHILRPFVSRLGPKQQHLVTSELANDYELKSAREAGLEAAGVNEPESWWKAKLEEYRKLALIDPAYASRLDDRLPRVSQVYEAHLRRIGRIDFDDIILGSLELVLTDEHVRRALVAKYPWFVIDEYQDLGLALHRMMEVLLETAGVRVFAVGDPDQSIYAFNGARPEFLDALVNRKGVSTVRLELNYRCRQTIIDASLHVLQPPETRNFVSAHEGDERGEIVFKRCENGLEEQAAHVAARIRERIDRGVPLAEIGVFAKRWGDLGTCETALIEAGIPYRLVRGRDYKITPLTTWIENMARWCAGGWRSGVPRMADIFAAWERVARACGGSLGGNAALSSRVTLYKTLSALRDPNMSVERWVEATDAGLGLTPLVPSPATPLRMRFDLRELSTMLAALRTGSVAAQTLAEFTGIDQDKVVLQSLHSSKGLEYAVVFMIALEDGVIPQYKESPQEARRLFYVGMTRAKREVHLLWSGFYFNAKGKLNEQGHSPFVTELWKRLRPKPKNV